MTNRNAILSMFMTMALALPAAMLVAPSDAFAIGGVLKSSRSDGKRVHKRANKKRTKRSSDKRKRTRKATRSKTSRRAVKRTSRRSTTRTSRRTNRRVVRRTTTRRPSRRVVHRSSRRTVHHHHHRRDTSSSTRTSSKSKSNIDVYFTGGLGTSGFSSTTISDEALPGLGYNLGLGVKGKLLGVELGFDGGGYTFDPEAGGTDLAYSGLFADLKLQPALDIFEPFAFVGVGGYLLADDILKENTEGGALRAGVGANIRIDDFAIGARYTYMAFSFRDDTGVYGGDFGGASESVGINLSVYF